MGAIADLATAAKAPARRAPPASGDGRGLWDRAFGATAKEDGHAAARQRARQANSHVRSAASDAAQMRLLQAMRSQAPGGWSDDRMEQSRHYTGITYICSHRIGEQMAQAEFQVFKKDPRHPDGKRPVTKQDPPEGGRLVPPYKLVELLERPNPDDTFGDLMYRWNQQLDLTGTALTWQVPNKLGVPFELYPVPTAIAVPQPVVNDEYPDGFYRIQPLYPYGPFSSYPTPNSAVGAAVPAQWMLRFAFPHPLLRWDGMSPLTAARFHLDSLEAVDRSRAYKMRRTFQPSAVLNMDEAEGAHAMDEAEIARMKAEFFNEFQGPDNVGNLFVCSPGARLDEWGARPYEMDYPAGWEQLTSFIMAIYGITKPAAGMVDDASYAVLFATLKQLHLLTLGPKCSRIGGKLTRHLAPHFGDDLIVEVRCPRIDDHEVKNAKLGVLIQGKAITKGELRREQDMPPWGDERDDEIAGTDPAAEQAAMQGAGGEGAVPGAPGGAEQPPGGSADAETGGPPGKAGRSESAAAIARRASAPRDASQSERALRKLVDKPRKDAEAAEAPQVTQSRPRPGTLGRGALGPRKMLLAAGRNGNGRH